MTHSLHRRIHRYYHGLCVYPTDVVVVLQGVINAYGAFRAYAVCSLLILADLRAYAVCSLLVLYDLKAYAVCSLLVLYDLKAYAVCSLLLPVKTNYRLFNRKYEI